MTTMFGPCVVCGAVGYELSCGGPTICPKCDCGHFDAATVMAQAKVIEQLRSELSDTEAQLDAFGKVSPQQYQKEIDILVKALQHVLQDDGLVPRASSKCRAVVAAALRSVVGGEKPR